MDLLKIISLAVIMFLIDIIWVGCLSKYFVDYHNTIIKVQKDPFEPKYKGGFYAYILMFLGFLVFVYPNVKSSNTPLFSSIYYGGLYGLSVYGIYNNTNYFIFKDWDAKTSIVDTIWGSVLYFIIAFISNRLNIRK